MSFSPKQEVLLRTGRRPRVWSVSFPVYGDNGVREDSALGLVAGVSLNGAPVRNDFDRIPIFQRPIFNATWDRASRSWVKFVPQDDPDFSWAPGEPYREVVYRCQPFWYRLDMEENRAPARISVTDRPLDGYSLAPMFKNGEDFVYRPCFEMALDKDGLPHSRAALTPYCAAMPDLMRKAREYDTAARLESVADWFSDALLQLVETAGWNFHARLPGNTGTAAALSGMALPYLVASVGARSSGSACCAWRGKENPWKNVNSTLCDVMLRKVTDAKGNRLEFCYLPDMRYFDGTLNAHYQTLGDYFTHSSGVTDICGFLSKMNIWYPARGATAGVGIKGGSYLNVDFTGSEPVAVAVGGSSTDAMMPTYVKSSPLNFEAADLAGWRAERFGARLVLDAAGGDV